MFSVEVLAAQSASTQRHRRFSQMRGAGHPAQARSQASPPDAILRHRPHAPAVASNEINQ